MLSSSSNQIEMNQQHQFESESEIYQSRSAPSSPKASSSSSSSLPLPSPVYQRRYSKVPTSSNESKVATSTTTSHVHSSRPVSAVSLTSAFKLVKTFNGEPDKFIKWRHEIKMAFKHLGWYYQLENNYFQAIESKERFSSIYIPSGESITDRLHREQNEEEKKSKLQLQLSLLTDQQRLDIDSGYALIWGTLGESLSDLLLPPNSQEGNPFDLYTNICLKFQSLTLLDKNRLQQQLDELKLGSNEDTDKFFARVSQLCTQLATAGVPISEEQIRFKIYKALPIEYKSVIKTYQITSPNMSIDILKLRLREEQAEMRDSKRGAGAGSANAFAQHSSSTHSKNKNKNKTKQKQNKTGGNSQSSSTSIDPFKAVCFRCGVTGHLSNDCKQDKSRLSCTAPGCKAPTGSHNFAAHKAREKHNNSSSTPSSSTSSFASVLMEVTSESNPVALSSYSKVTTSSSQVATSAFSKDGKVTTSSSQVATSSSSSQDSKVTTSSPDSQVATLSSISNQDQPITLVLDSGCTGHVVQCLDWLSDICDVESLQFGTASGQICISNKIGTLTVRLDNGTLLSLTDVRYAPGLVVNLISVDQLESKGTTILFQPNSGYALLTNTQGHVLQVPKVGKLRLLHGIPIVKNTPSNKECAYSITPALPTVNEEVTTSSLPISKVPTSKSKVATSLSKVTTSTPASKVATSTCYNHSHDITGTTTPNSTSAVVYPIESAGLSLEGGALLSEYDLWHHRLGHIARTGLESVIKSQCVQGMELKADIKSTVSLSNCSSCEIAKAKRLSYADIKIDHITSIMDQWDMDLCGPFHSSAGTHYMLIIMDVHSRYTFIKIIDSKDNAEQEIINLITLEQNQTNKKLRKLHSDGGGEFGTIILDNFCAEQGILRTTTTRNTAQHNAKVERANGTIISNTRASLLHGAVPDGFWRYAAINTVYIRNRVTTKGINVGKSITEQVTPFQLWFGRRPDIKHLRVLFCDCYYINETKLPGKLQLPGVPAIYVGYNEIKSGYNCYDIATDKVITTRHVKFIENSFTHSAKLKINVDSSAYDYTNQSEQDLFSSHLDQNELELVKQISLQEYNSSNLSKVTTSTSSSSSSNDSSSTIRNGDISGPMESTKENHTSKVPTSKVATSTSNPKVTTSQSKVATSSSPVQTKTKVKFDSINQNNIIANGSSRRRNTVWRLGMVDYEKDVSAHSFFSDKDEIAIQHFALSTSVSDLPDPKNYKEAMSSSDAEQWKSAMQKEINSLTDNVTWKLVVLPSGAHVMGCRWVFKKKIDADGNINYKARLCAQGFSQKEDEYGETYAPVLGYSSLRILLSIATVLDYDLNQWDVCTAFLNADVQETIYMKQPEGFITPDGKVCKLIKTLYGLKQSPYEWNKLLNSFFIEHGWLRCISDPCIYHKMSKTNKIMFTGVFVDDSIAGNSPADRVEFNEFKSLFMKRFKSVDLGEVKQILGMLVVRDRKARTLFLHQKPYILKILKTFNMLNCKPATTPEAMSLVKLLPKERIPIKTDDDYEKHRSQMNESPHSQYLAIVGSVIYLMISTRPDIAHAVHILSRYMSNYTDLHYKCAKHLLRYLRGTTDYGLLFTSKGSNIINASGISHIAYTPSPEVTTSQSKVATSSNLKVKVTTSSPDSQVATSTTNKVQVTTSSSQVATSTVNTDMNEQDSMVSSITTLGMSDANYGGDRESLHGNIKLDYKSTTASLVYAAGNLVDYKSTRQSRVAQSSCESEYMAACKTANKMVWVDSLLTELSFPQLSPSILYVDNQAAIALSKNTYTGDHSRHIAIPFHVLKEYTEHSQIDTQWVDTKSQYADILTKCLSKDLFIPLRDKLVSKLL